VELPPEIARLYLILNRVKTTDRQNFENQGLQNKKAGFQLLHVHDPLSAGPWSAHAALRKVRSQKI